VPRRVKLQVQNVALRSDVVNARGRQG
jgi:hypothetical protein